MSNEVMLVADAGEQAGLGHISRSTAVAVALRCRGIETRCYAHGAAEPLERDGVRWAPLGGERLPDSPGGVLVVDSYLLPSDELARAAGSARLVVMHDYGSVPEDAALVVSAAAPPSDAGSGRLSGLAYAALRPVFWGLPARELRDHVEHVLVTTGSGNFAEVGCELAEAVGNELPGVRVTLVRGPHGTIDVPSGIELLDGPDSLLEPLLATDLVVTAGGQTMLEAATAGTPCVALPLVDNQRRQALRLAGLGAVRLVDPPSVSEVAAAASELAREPEARREMSREGQHGVDGYGALRVAFHIGRMVSQSR